MVRALSFYTAYKTIKPGIHSPLNGDDSIMLVIIGPTKKLQKTEEEIVWKYKRR